MNMHECFQEGRRARLEGMAREDNPYFVGRTKLGSLILNEPGLCWEQGFNSIARKASDAEMRAAATVEVSRFRRKSNRSYR